MQKKDKNARSGPLSVKGKVKGIGRDSPMKSKVTHNSDSPRIKDKANVIKDEVKDMAPVKDKVQVNLVLDNAPAVVKKKLVDVKEKSTGKPVVDAVNDKPDVYVVKDKALDVVKEKLKDKAETADVTNKPAVDVVKDNASEVVKENRKTELPKDKPKNNAPEVVKEKRKTELLKDKPKDKESSVVNGNVSTELPKDKPKDKASYVVKGNVLVQLPKDKHKADLSKDKPKPKDKHKANQKFLLRKSRPVFWISLSLSLSSRLLLTVQATTEVRVLRSSKQKVKPEVKPKAVVHVLRFKETHVKRKMNLLKECDRKKKGKMTLSKGKSKKLDSSSSLETDEFDSLSDEVYQKSKKLMIKGGLKRKRNGSNSDSSSVDEETMRRMFNKLKKKVTHLKIHEILGVPVGGYSLFDLEERQDDHEFVRMGIADRLKDQICLDVVRRLHEDCVISNIDWCNYIYDCLQYSKLPEGTNHYRLYLDSTKFDRFPIVLTCPAIRNWSSYLMKQRQKLELKDHVIGLLELQGEWTEAEVQETEGFTGDDLFKKAEEKLSLICNERVLLEEYMRKASLEYPCDGKFAKIYEMYVQLFKEPISFNDDDVGSGNDYGNGDGDSRDDDDRNKDDNIGFMTMGMRMIWMEMIMIMIKIRLLMTRRNLLRMMVEIMIVTDEVSFYTIRGHLTP
nr:hypothetical protein [Tanacetum cinerariifolium]